MTKEHIVYLACQQLWAVEKDGVARIVVVDINGKSLHHFVSTGDVRQRPGAVESEDEKCHLVRVRLEEEQPIQNSNPEFRVRAQGVGVVVSTVAIEPVGRSGGVSRFRVSKEDLQFIAGALI